MAFSPRGQMEAWVVWGFAVTATDDAARTVQLLVCRERDNDRDPAWRFGRTLRADWAAMPNDDLWAMLEQMTKISAEGIPALIGGAVGYWLDYRPTPDTIARTAAAESDSGWEGPVA